MIRNTKPIILGMFNPSRAANQYKILVEIKGRVGLTCQFIINADLSRNAMEVVTPFSMEIFPLMNTHRQHISLSEVGVKGIVIVIERERNDRVHTDEEQSQLLPSETLHIDIIGTEYLSSISWKNMEI